MTTRELIERLRELDPDGTMMVVRFEQDGSLSRIADGDIGWGLFFDGPEPWGPCVIPSDEDEPGAFRAVTL